MNLSVLKSLNKLVATAPVSRLSRGVVVAAIACASATAHGGEQAATGGAAVRPAPPTAPRLLVGPRSNLFSTIRGNALSEKNTALPGAPVRLRDARSGRIVDTQITDNAGLFTFTTSDPGSYIVEVMANDNSVLAASQIINIDVGQAVTAVVRLPFRVPPFRGALGPSMSSAVAITSAAVAAGVLATTVSGSPVSPVVP